MIQTIGIVGAGAVARALAAALTRRGAPERSLLVWARRPEAAAEVARLGHGRALPVDSLEDLGAADVILVAVSDKALESVGELLAKTAWQATAVLHTGGARTGEDAFEALELSGMALGSLHPLVAVAADAEPSPQIFLGRPFAVEATTAEATDAARDLVAAMGGFEVELPPADTPSAARELKLRYHALATMVATGVVSLVDQAADAMAPGDPAARERFRRAYGELARSAVDNVLRERGAKVLTGAIARGDADLVERHLAALADTSNEGLYRAVEGAARHMLAGRQPSSGSPARSPAGPLVVSLLARSLEDFRTALELGAAGTADVVEFRLDHVAGELISDGGAAFADLVKQSGRPTIAAIHGDEGFGTYQGSTQDRGRVLEAAARAGVSYLDIDASLLAEAALEGIETPRILSTHRGLAAIDAASLDEVAAELDALVRPGHGDLVKIVPAAERAADVLVIFDWLERRRAGSTIAFASGHVAAFSRMAAPAFGSVFVYAAPASIEEPGGTSASRSPLLGQAAPGQLRVPHLRAVWGGFDANGTPHVPGPATRIAAVCGRPIGHSASPVTHAAALRALGADGLFLPVAPASFAAFAEAARAHPRWVGLSVTAPFKLEAIDLAEGEHGAGADEASAAIGAANTLCFRACDGGPERRYAASNTDSPAVGVALEEALEREDFSGLEAVVIGAGGAARAAVHALVERGAAVTIAARRIEAAEVLAASARGAANSVAAADLHSAAYQSLRPDIIVHTTPLGTDGIGEPEVPAEHLRPGVAVLDAVYRPKETALLRRAADAGAIPVSGERWFLAQAWLQHGALFADLYPDLDIGQDAPKGAAAQAAMRAALDDWLSGRTSSHPS